MGHCWSRKIQNNYINVRHHKCIKFSLITNILLTGITEGLMVLQLYTMLPTGIRLLMSSDGYLKQTAIVKLLTRFQVKIILFHHIPNIIKKKTDVFKPVENILNTTFFNLPILVKFFDNKEVYKIYKLDNSNQNLIID